MNNDTPQPTVKESLTVQKPTELEIWLYENHKLFGVKVETVQTGIDTTETYVTISGSKGDKRIPHHTFEKYLVLQYKIDSVAQLNYDTREKVRKWKAFEEEHKADLAEFERLSKKLADAQRKGGGAQ